MKVPFLDLRAQYHSIKDEVNEAVLEVLESTAYASGPYVEKFEKEFAAAHNVAHCVALNSGTSALHLALLSLGIGKDDEVIIPAHTFVATAWAVSYVGATPVFCDVTNDTYTLDPLKIEAKITDRTKAIIPVHLYGQPADMDTIMIVAEKYNLRVIEDAAQSHIAEYNGKKIGGLADIACFSFYPGKNLGAYGEGGAITTNSDILAEKCKLLRNHAQPVKYVHTEVGYNYRMDGIQGAVLSVKLRHLDNWTEQRRAIAERYTMDFSKVGGLTPPKERDNTKHVYHLYELGLETKEKRDELMEYLKQNEIHSGLHYPIPTHLQEAYIGLGYKVGDFPVTEWCADNLLSLPMYPDMTDEMVEYVIKKVTEFAKK
ncbi:MAG: DegT/DnrJ/EryC1/StrS family aminotransferase [Candidatus Kapaibacterium sp.]